ncbi:MAG TPA: MotA/TolQ/ExbB proton channel family protein [Pirellulales bacterium]|nr:MotA/TolQ/ExbB proton channel family protein [Pirellulales bacterium]
MVFAIIVAVAQSAAAESKKNESKKPSKGKPAPASAAELEQAQRKAQAALQAADTGAKENQARANDTVAELPATPETPNLLNLWFKGGPLMWPITLMSVLVVIFAVERSLGLRRRKVIPPRLVDALGQLAARPGGLDPRAAYQLCQQFPSTTANVLKSVLLKVGRPQSEVEHAVHEASEREAAKLYKNVRTINLATTITPLLGLLGTVQGMIECFFITAHLPVGADKSEHLANGIYIALVTTFGGLVVAIPASVFAHYFEGRIQTLFREIDELLLGLLPQLERFEGKMRMTRTTGELGRSSSLGASPAAAAANPQPLAPSP